MRNCKLKKDENYSPIKCELRSKQQQRGCRKLMKWSIFTEWKIDRAMLINLNLPFSTLWLSTTISLMEAPQNAEKTTKTTKLFVLWRFVLHSWLVIELYCFEFHLRSSSCGQESEEESKVVYIRKAKNTLKEFKVVDYWLWALTSTVVDRHKQPTTREASVRIILRSIKWFLHSDNSQGLLVTCC